MRVAPVGLVGHDCMAGPVFHLGAESAALTHGHPSGYLSAGVMAALIHSLLQGRRAKLYKRNEHDHDPLAEALSLLWDYSDHEETLEAVNRASKYPPAEPVALRLLAPQRGLFATVRSKSKNKSKSLVLLSSLPQHRQFKGEHTPGILKVLLPPRQSRGISLLELGQSVLCTGILPRERTILHVYAYCCTMFG